MVQSDFAYHAPAFLEVARYLQQTSDLVPPLSSYLNDYEDLSSTAVDSYYQRALTSHEAFVLRYDGFLRQVEMALQRASETLTTVHAAYTGTEAEHVDLAAYLSQELPSDAVIAGSVENFPLWKDGVNDDPEHPLGAPRIENFLTAPEYDEGPNIFERVAGLMESVIARSPTAIADDAILVLCGTSPMTGLSKLLLGDWVKVHDYGVALGNGANYLQELAQCVAGATWHLLNGWDGLAAREAEQYFHDLGTRLMGVTAPLHWAATSYRRVSSDIRELGELLAQVLATLVDMVIAAAVLAASGFVGLVLFMAIGTRLVEIVLTLADDVVFHAEVHDALVRDSELWHPDFEQVPMSQPVQGPRRGRR